MESYKAHFTLISRCKQARFCVRCGRNFEKTEDKCVPLCRVCLRNYFLDEVALKDVCEDAIKTFRHKQYMKFKEESEKLLESFRLNVLENYSLSEKEVEEAKKCAREMNRENR